jgi:predicted Zn-dependent protease
LIGCSSHSDIDFNKEPYKKAFEQEDTYILYALYAEEKKQYMAAAGLYEMLYKYSGKNEYKYRELANYSLAGKYDTLLEKCGKYQEEDESDLKLKRFEILALIKLLRYDEAKEKALSLVDKTKATEDYLLVSEIYIKQKHYDTALKYLERAYTVDYDEAILDQMAVILYVNLDRKSDAMAQLESHSRIHGCSAKVCMRLASFYSKQNDIDGMLSTYLRLYESEPSDEVAEAIIRIYSYQKNMPKLLVFLEESRAHDPILLQMYIEEHAYKKAAKLAKELYEKEGDATYLAQSAIFRYESAEDKNDKDMLHLVIRDLKRAIHDNPTPLSLNYLGYLMIDHAIDVKEGMEYVREALKIEPESAFYLDSLAWGYYRENRCDKAQDIMKKVIKALGSDDAEVKKHIDAINRCLDKEN